MCKTVYLLEVVLACLEEDLIIMTGIVPVLAKIKMTHQLFPVWACKQ